MSTYTQTHKMKPAMPPLYLQVAAALSGGAILFMGLALVGLFVFNLAHLGKIYPHVSVAGIDLSGKTPEQAVDLLNQNFRYPTSGKVGFQWDDQVWVASPEELGLSLDAQGSADTAYAWGRSGNPLKRFIEQLRSWQEGVNLPPKLVYDEQTAFKYLSQIAAQIDRPTIEASLSIEGTEVLVLPGQVGRTLDKDSSLLLLREQLLTTMDGILPLVVHESPPIILDASQQADIARQILSQPLVLQIPEASESDPGPWVLPPDQLAKKLTISRTESERGWEYQVAFDEEALRQYLSALEADLSHPPQNARFIFNDDTRQLDLIQPAVIGRKLDVEATIEEINRRVMQGEHNVPLAVTWIQPQVSDDASGEELGITELVEAYTSYFRGSSSERMHNIQTAAENFHGLLVPPGAVFSMAEHMGDVSLDNGYAEAWIIYGGRTIKGVGGGVCQVSTTLFRTAFFAGFPIVERHPHAYRVSYYEQTARGYDPNLAGLDATVFVPLVDFKFKNDTPYWLLMETYFNPVSRSLTWKFYSTSDGRTVDWETTGPQNIVEPPDPLYEENPELPKGEIKQVDWAAEGADVRVTRTVSRAGEVLFSDVFNTHYMPWRDIFQYGPGTKLPKKAKKKNSLNLDSTVFWLPVAFLFARKIFPKTKNNRDVR